MPKNFFEDMVRIKREKSGIPFDAPLPTLNNFSPKPKPKIKPKPIQEFRTESKPEPRYTPEVERESFQDKFASVYDVVDRGPKRGSKSMWWIAGISVLFLLFALSYLFTGAKVVITPKSQAATFDQSLTAVKDSSDENITFDLVVLSGEETKLVPGGEEQDVLKRSKGKVIIFNNFSTASQNLDIDTRLEGSNGKIYKTETKTTVPGKSKTGTPGAVEVNIYASEAGSEYDSGPLDFTIFGFKGTPKYSKFYARSKDGTSITGGFKGKVKAVSEEDRKLALEELNATLKDSLSKKASDQIPVGFILFKDAGFLETQEVLPTTTAPSTDGNVPITIKGTYYGVLFDEVELTKKIAKDLVPGYADEDVYIPNMRELTFSIKSKETPLKDIKNLSFDLTGTGKIVWKVDIEKFLGDILGKKKKDFDETLAQYPNIDSATLSIRPVWKMTFPEKEKNINIVVLEP